MFAESSKIRIRNGISFDGSGVRNGVSRNRYLSTLGNFRRPLDTFAAVIKCFFQGFKPTISNLITTSCVMNHR